jgi:hypothetical protein
MICASPYDNHKCWNCISGVMVSILALSALDHGFEAWSNQTTRPGRIKPMTIKLVFVAFMLSM